MVFKEKGSGKTWKITDFDVSDKREKFYLDLDKTRMALGREICGETKRKHLQIFITFRRNYSFKSLQKITKTAKLLLAKDLDWNYELKDMDYILDDRRKQGSRTDLKVLYQDLLEGANMRQITNNKLYWSLKNWRTAEKWLTYNESKRPIAPIKVIVLWGETGVGKTKNVYDRYDTRTEVFSPVSYKWWDGYDGHKTILLDEFRSDWCSFHHLLRLIDIYPLKVEVKGGSREAQWDTIFITSNRPPHEWYHTTEDTQQLLRRITEVVHLEKNRTEVGEGNTLLPQPIGLKELKDFIRDKCLTKAIIAPNVNHPTTKWGGGIIRSD